jgi:hypothetical protein
MDEAVACFNVVSCCLSGATEKIKVRTVGAVTDIWNGQLHNTSRLLRFLLSVYLTTLFTYIDLLTVNMRMNANDELGKRIPWPVFKCCPAK